MDVKLLTEHHLEFLSLKGGCTGSYESTLVKMPHCWKSHVEAHILSTGIQNERPKLNDQRSTLTKGLIYSHCLSKLNISSENSDILARVLFFANSVKRLFSMLKMCILGIIYLYQ